MNKSYIDIHCHPALKPYGKSFKYTPTKINAPNSGRKNSIWHYSPPNFLERKVNKLLTLTKFTQTDFTALAKSGCQVVIVSLYPFEKHFLKEKILGFKFISDILVNLAAGVSQKRIDNLRNHNSYFEDLKNEYDFYLQLNNFAEKIGDTFYTYRVVKNYQDIIENENASSENRKVISVVLSIEGAHALETGLNKDKDTADEATVLSNLAEIKNWLHKPLFITLAHHFYNEICGHARSINLGLIKKQQNRGLNSGISNLGFKVIDGLLDNSNNNRILIDIKHMSIASRKIYYNLLKGKYAQENIPIIVSHGAVNGRTNFEDSSPNTDKFNNEDINFFDEELIEIAKSNGIFGLQLDERRIASKKYIRKSRWYFPTKKNRCRNKAELVWNQVEHIAKVLNTSNLFCWDITSIGSDFDGIVNPIKGLWTSENIKDIREFLIAFAEAFLQKNNTILLDINKIPSVEIIDRLLFKNAQNFLQKNYT